MLNKCNYLRIILVLFTTSILSQVNDCIVHINDIVPSELNVSKVAKGVSELKLNEKTYINKEELIKTRESDEKPYTTWIQITSGWDEKNPKILELITNYGEWYNKTAIFINPETILNTELQVIYTNKHNSRMIAFKNAEGEIYATYLKSNYNTLPLFINKSLSEKRKIYQDQFTYNTSLVFDELNLKSDSYYYYKVESIDFSNIPKLIIKQYNSFDNSSDGQLYEYIISKNQGNIYNYDCYSKIWSQKKEKYEKYLSDNFSAKEINAIKKQVIHIGMSENALYESIGRPIETNSQTGNGYTLKQLVYGDGVFIYIKNSKVESYQNFESFKH